MNKFYRYDFWVKGYANDMYKYTGSQNHQTNLNIPFVINDLATMLPLPIEVLPEDKIVCAQSLILAATGPNPVSCVFLNSSHYSVQTVSKTNNTVQTVQLGIGGNYRLEMVTNGRTKSGICTKR